MESRRRKSKATIHTVGSEFQSFLADIKLTKFNGIFFFLDLVFDEFTLLDEVSEDIW